MADSHTDLLKSLRRHARVQTVLQAGALIELEAQRRQLAAQTEMMKEEASRADLREYQQEDAAEWRRRVADLESELEGDSAVKMLTALLLNESYISFTPDMASLDEISRAKKLLRTKAALWERVRAEDPGLSTRLASWWKERRIADRVEQLRPVGDEVTAAIESAEKVSDEEIVLRLSAGLRAMKSLHKSMEEIEADRASLEPAGWLLLLDLHPQESAFFRENVPLRRQKLLAELEQVIETVAAANEAKIRTAKTTHTLKYVFLWVAIALVVILVALFVYDLDG